MFLAYWSDRCSGNTHLQRVSPYMVAVLQLKPAVCTIENYCCEIGRRRAAALAYAAGVVSTLPKGKFKLYRIESPENLKVRSLATMEVLVRVGDCITFVPLKSLL